MLGASIMERLDSGAKWRGRWLVLGGVRGRGAWTGLVVGVGLNSKGEGL